MAAAQQLLQLQIITKDKIWDRCLISQFIPPIEDLEFYYRQLLGFSDAKIEVNSESIPDDFNTSLLPCNFEVPCDYPSNDLETSYDETERRGKYKQFITQLCEMERSRAALKNYSRISNAAKEANKPKYTTALTEESLHLIGYANDAYRKMEQRAWVQDVLRSLDPESFEENESPLAINDTSAPPIGWIIVPVQTSARQSMGCRIILDTAIGKKWERMLGTDIYPDLIILRRLHTQGWTYSGPQSDKLLSNLVEWYLSSQDAVIENGMSNFIVGLEKELISLILSLKSVKVGERFLNMDDDSDPRVQVQKILRKLETDCLDSASNNPSIQPVSTSVFHRLLGYAFKTAKIPRETYVTDDKIGLVVERWVRSQMGLRVDADPLVPEWKTIWDLVMRSKPSSIRLNHFLASMDSWDPVAGVSLTKLDRAAIAQEWVRIYADTQLIRGESFKVRSVVLHDEVRKWCLKHIPESIFSSQLSCVNIGPVLTKKGLKVTKLKGGRYVLGIKFRSLVGSGEDIVDETAATEEEIRIADEMAASAATESLKEANSVQYTTVTKDNEDGTQTKQRVIEHTIVSEKDGARIEHYFTASVTTETIDLGSV
jgi:hypothetical protein